MIFPICVTGCRRLKAVLVLLAMSMAGVAQSSALASVRIYGQAVDRFEIGVRGATVRLIAMPDRRIAATTPTNPDGSFEFRHVKPGTYELAIEAAGFILLRRTVVAAGGAHIEVSGIVLEEDSRPRPDFNPPGKYSPSPTPAVLDLRM